MINQELAELTRCYSNVDLPNSIDSSLDPSLSFEELILQFGLAARRAIHMPELQRHLRNGVKEATSGQLSDEALVELFWFLFSQKDWLQIRLTADCFKPRLQRLPLHVADLIFLAFYRSQRDHLVAGKERDSFQAEASLTIKFIREGWPAAKRHFGAYDGMLAHAIGDIERARNAFVSVGDIKFIEPFAGISSVLADENYDNAEIADYNIEIKPSGADHATVLSLDEVYFAKYARLVARRYAETNPANGLHFHCVGFDPHKEIESWNLPVKIGFTIDRINLSQMEVRQKRGYFASARYIYLSRYLELYQTVFIADVDGHVARDVGKMHMQYADLDVILSTKVLDRSRTLNRLPWESITACSFMARKTPGGEKFAGRIGRYLQKVVQNATSLDRPIWYGDQTALFYSWLDCECDVKFGIFGKAAFVQRGSWQLFQGEKERLDFLANP